LARKRAKQSPELAWNDRYEGDEGAAFTNKFVDEPKSTNKWEEKARLARIRDEDRRLRDEQFRLSV
jgi:hypothetical protein